MTGYRDHDDVLAELATVYVKDTLRKWVPEVQVIEVGTKRVAARHLLTVRFASRFWTGYKIMSG